MNKLELIDTLKNECQITKKEAAAIVDIFLIKSQRRLLRVIGLKSGDYALFFVKEYKSYPGRNPKTGESVTVALKKLLFFKIGKELKEQLDF